MPSNWLLSGKLAKNGKQEVNDYVKFYFFIVLRAVSYMVNTAHLFINPMKNNNKTDLTTGDIRHHLLRLGAPMIWGIFAVLSYQLADMFFISMLGTKELAAFTFTFPVTMLVFYCVMSLGVATSSVLSRMHGRKDEVNVRQFAIHVNFIALCTGLVLAITGILLTDPLFRLLGATEEKLAMLREYMHLWFIGSVFLTLPIVNNAAMRAGGDSTTPAILMTLVAVINVALDPVLIFGLFGFPRLELQGAALASLIANFCAMCAGLYILSYKKKILFRSPFSMKSLPQSFRALSRVAVPSALSNTVMPLAQAVIIALLASSGTAAVAAFGVATRIEAFALIVIMAVATGMGPIIGQNWAAGKYERVYKTLRYGLGFFFAYCLAIACLLAFLGESLAGIFSDDKVVISLAAAYFLIIPASQAFGTLINGWASTFNAIDMARRALVMTTVRMLVIIIPSALIGNFLYGVTGIFLAIAFGNIVSGILFHILNWRKCRAMQKKAA